MKNLLPNLVIAALATTSARAQTPEDLSVRPSSKGLMAKTEGEQFDIDPGLANKIYDSSVKASVEAPVTTRRIGVAIQPEFGQLAPSNVVLRSRHYEVGYNDQVDALSGGTLRASVELYDSPRFVARAGAAASYYSRQAIVEARSTSGVIAKDDVFVTAGEVLGIVEAEWKFASFPMIRPMGRAGAGMSRISQSGKLDGIEQSGTGPLVSAGGGLVLFPAPAGEQGFDGIAVTGGYDQAFVDQQDFACRRWDVGARFTF